MMKDVLQLDNELPEYSKICTFCKHAKGNKICDAFPSGIPADIWLGKHDHKTPYQGDKGIMFTSKK